MIPENADAHAGMDEITDSKFVDWGGIAQGDPLTYCPNVWNYVIDRFCIGSVMDLGSGSGHVAAWFFKKGIKTVAVEGLSDNVQTSVYPAIKHDLTMGSATSVVDMVHCQEVVEHIEAKYLDNLLKSLACGKIILMTHAPPNQDCYHHVNLQPMKYWVDHIQGMGYNLMVTDTARIRKLAAYDGASYMAQSGLIFHRKK